MNKTLKTITDKELKEVHEAAKEKFWAFSKDTRLRKMAEAIEQELKARNIQFDLF